MNIMRMVAVAVVGVHLGGCGSDDVHDHPQLTTGKQLFDHHCAQCHKPSGRGNLIKGVPPSRNTDLSPEQIGHKLRAVDSQTGMPAFPNMPEAEAKLIAQYVHTL